MPQEHYPMTRESVAQVLTELNFTFTTEQRWHHGELSVVRLLNESGALVFKIDEHTFIQEFNSPAALETYIKLLKNDKGEYVYLPNENFAARQHPSL